MWNLFLALLLLSPSAQAAKIKVEVYHQEDTCEAKLDTKKMSKLEFDRITELYKFLEAPRNYNPLKFLDERREIAETRALVAENKKFLENSIKAIPSFRRARWKKLGEQILHDAQVRTEVQLAAIAFMDTWDPKPLLASDKPDDSLASRPYVDTIKDESPEKLEQRTLAEEKRLLALPLEERPISFLTCDQRLRILADDSKLEKFSPSYAHDSCQHNSSPQTCRQKYTITPGMKKAEREGLRMDLFQWAWYSGFECAYKRGQGEESDYDYAKLGSLKDLFHSALSGLECESNGCDD